MMITIEEVKKMYEIAKELELEGDFLRAGDAYNEAESLREQLCQQMPKSERMACLFKWENNVLPSIKIGMTFLYKEDGEYLLECVQKYGFKNNLQMIEWLMNNK